MQPARSPFRDQTIEIIVVVFAVPVLVTSIRLQSFH